MEQRISLVTLGVDDLDRSLEFYRSLGWRRGNAEKEVVFFQTGGMVVALWSRGSLAKDANLPQTPPGGFSGMALAHNVGSRQAVDAVIAEAEVAGARILKQPRDTSWGGYSGYFADPDGHVWEVAWNPFWTLGSDGSVSLPG